MGDILNEIIGILSESSVYLLLGFLLAGVLHVILTRFPRVTALFTGSGTRPVFMSTLLGLPMPLCSCSVLPAAMTLRRKGASRGATSSFLISVPETDIVSILLTLALLGGVMAIYRPTAALVTALAAGLLVNALDRRLGPTAPPAEASPHGAGAGEHSHSCHACHDEEDILEKNDVGPWYRRAFRYGFIKMFDDIIAQLFLGIVVAGVLMAWLPGIEVVSQSHGAVWTYAVMLIIGVPVYVCAVASTPVAAGLILGGVSPGAAMVFLLAGPATNIASLFVLRGEFGPRLLAVYLGVIMVGSVAAGALFDMLLGAQFSVEALAGHGHTHGVSPLKIAATAVFLLFTLKSFHRTNLAGRLKTRILRLVRNP